MSTVDGFSNIDRPVVMLSKRYASGDDTGWHTHDRVQFLYASSGIMTALTHAGSRLVPEGHGLIIPNGTHHTVRMFGDVALQSAYISPTSITLQSMEDCQVGTVTPLLKACLDRLAIRPKAYHADDIAVPLAAIVISELKVMPQAEFALPMPKMARLKWVTEALVSDAASTKSVDDWAMEIGMSRRSFTRSFKNELGMSFIQWRQRLRFQVASQLIAAGIPLSRVAAKTGYSSSSVLIAMMRRLVQEGDQY